MSCSPHATGNTSETRCKGCSCCMTRLLQGNTYQTLWCNCSTARECSSPVVCLMHSMLAHGSYSMQHVEALQVNHVSAGQNFGFGSLAMAHL